MSKSEEKFRDEVFDLIEARQDLKIIDKIPYPKIFYATRTHSQIATVIKELKKTNYRPKMVVLGSRNQYCINPTLTTSINKNDDCLKLTHDNECIYFRNVDDLVESPKFTPQGDTPIWDIEDLVSEGQNLKACTYYASQHMLEHADIVFCPYNYLIDPNIRFSTNIPLKGNVFIFDEAHNIEDVSRSSASFTGKLYEFDSAQKEILKVIDMKVMSGDDLRALRAVFLKVIAWMDSVTLKEYKTNMDANIYSGDQIIQILEEFGLKLEKFILHNKTFSTLCNVLAEMDPRDNMSSKSKILIEHFFSVVGFCYEEKRKFLGDYRVVLIKAKDVVEVNFWCMNPRVAFNLIKKECHNIILTSGTLSPMDSFQSELEIDFTNVFEGSHVIDMKKQLLVHSIFEGPRGVKLNMSYKDSGSVELQASLGEMILKYAQLIEYGVLVFFPSYSLMDRLIETWKESGVMDSIKKCKKIFYEPRRSDKPEQFASLLREYDQEIENYANATNKDELERTGAIFFAVCRGKVSEGLDFSDNKARAVIVIGIPYPSLVDLQIDLKKKFNDELSKRNTAVLNGMKWYCLQAYRAVNQAIGRCIRHRNDHGCIILMDERYQQQNTLNGLSKWLRPAVLQLKGVPSVNLIKVFFQRMKNAQMMGSLTQSIVKREDMMPTQRPMLSQDQYGGIPTQSFSQEIQILPKEVIFCKKCSKEVCTINGMINLKNLSYMMGVGTLSDPNFSGDVFLVEKFTGLSLQSRSWTGFDEQTLDMNQFKIKDGYRTGFIENDGIVYLMMFCKYDETFLGVKVHAVTSNHVEKLDKVYLFPTLVTKTKQEDTRDTPDPKRVKIEIN